MTVQPGQLKNTSQNLANSATTSPSLEKMLEQQKEILLEILHETKKTARYILVGRVISFIYLILLVAPIIFAIIYLPSLLEKTIAPYQELLNVQGNVNLDSDTVNDILKQLGR